MALEDDAGIEVAAFVIDQDTATDANLCCSPILTTAGGVERRSGLGFFPDLSESEQNSLEGSSASTW